MRNPLIPRDVKLEHKISQAQKAEYTFGILTPNIKQIFISDQFQDFKKLPFKLPNTRLLNYCKENEVTLDKALCRLSHNIQCLDDNMKVISDSNICSIQEKVFSIVNELKKLKKEKQVNEHFFKLKDKLFELCKHIVIPSNMFFWGRKIQQVHDGANITTIDGYVYCGIRIDYFQEFKILTPYFHDTLTSTRRQLYFNPFYKNSPLLNLYFLKMYPEATVILTDSIEYAHKNQHYLNKAGITDIVWVSWYGDADAVDKIDWTPLARRKIYYLLKEHSGMGTSQVYKIALEINKKLSLSGFLTITYISLLPDPGIQESPSMENLNSPVIWNNQTFLQYAKIGYCRLPYSYDLYYESQRILEHSDSILVFKPFIYSRCVTLLYGNQSAKTWVAFNIAAAVKHGAKMWDGCYAPKPASVLYIHGKMKETTMIEKLKKVEKQYSTDTTESIMCFSLPDEIGDGKASLSSDIHFIYLQIELFQKQYGKHPALIIMDSLAFIDKLSAISGKKIKLNAFINNMKIHGCSILIVHDVASVNKSSFSNWKKNLAIDSMIKMEKEDPVVPSRIAISMSIRSGVRDSNVKNYQQVEIDLNASSPKWTVLTDERSKQEEIALINNLLWKGNLEDPDIARSLNLTLDVVKKRKSTLRKDYKDIVLDSLQKKGLQEHQISTKYNIAPSIVARIIQKASRSKSSTEDTVY